MINYYLLIKPGIICGNLITFAAGFLLASRGHFDLWLFLQTLFGMSCIIAAACVCNNYIDRFVDQKMERTKKRGLATGAIKTRTALAFAAAIGLFGNYILWRAANGLTVVLADVGFAVYVFLYSFLKCRTTYSTLIGSVSGAIPPVVGYCAVSGELDAAALILFMIMVFWQMPHFFAIGLWRQSDYQKAGIPILPVAKGAYRTKVHMVLYIVALLPAMAMLTLLGYTGYLFMVCALAAGGAWLVLALSGFRTDQDAQWGRQMFRVSLVVINVLCLLLPFDLAR